MTDALNTEKTEEELEQEFERKRWDLLDRIANSFRDIQSLVPNLKYPDDMSSRTTLKRIRDSVDEAERLYTKLDDLEHLH